MEKGRTNPYTLEFFPNQYEIPVTFVRTVAEELCALKFVTNHFDTEGKCAESVHKCSQSRKFVSDFLKNQEMCIKTVEEDLSNLFDVAFWFAKRSLAENWDNDKDLCKYDELADWNNSYKKRKVKI